jgi:hypothetical protein
MSKTYQVISADGHCEAAPDYWHPYVPEKHRARAPRLIDVAEGGVAWQVEGQPLRPDEQQTYMTLNALDSGTTCGSRINLSYRAGHVYPAKESSRTYATLRIAGLAADAHLNEAEQLQLCDEFNAFLEKKRTETWSLFLPQFRESKEYARKRIPFELAYRIIMHHLIILIQLRENGGTAHPNP